MPDMPSTNSVSGDPADSFFNEDLSKPENRINVALFGAQAIPEFWARCRAYLGLSGDALLRRVTIAGEQSRPDFLVIENGNATRWIEAELGGRNAQQLAKYSKARLVPPDVLSLVGPKANRHGDCSLEEIAGIAEDIAATLVQANPPAREMLICLAEMIHKSVSPDRVRPTVQSIPEHLMAQPWFEHAVAPLLELREAGYVMNRPSDAGSLSLRLKRGPSVNCADSFALLSQRGANNDFLVPEPDEMARLFKGPLQRAVPYWRMLLDRVRPRWDAHVARNKRISVPSTTFQQHATEFNGFYRFLRNRLMSGSAPLPEALGMDEGQQLLLIQRGGFVAEVTRAQAGELAAALAAFAAAERHADLPESMKAKIHRLDPMGLPIPSQKAVDGDA